MADGWEGPGIEGLSQFEVIGRGGFSVVYRAWQEGLDRHVAVKVLLTDLSDSDDARRFRRECSVLGRLSRERHVVDVYDVGITRDRRPYIVMRYYPAGTLAARLREHGPIPAGEAVNILTDLAQALQTGHDQGVIHRDIKPDNVLIDDDGQVALTDFGIASLIDGSHTSTASAAFSQPYAAPEVLDTNNYGRASDLYSLAATGYALLTGAAPFHTTSGTRQLLAITSEPPDPITTPGVPPALGETILTAMAKNPDDRPLTPRAFADLLKTALTAATPDNSAGVPQHDPSDVPAPSHTFCRQCGTRLTGSGAFCPWCGSSQDLVESAPTSIRPAAPSSPVASHSAEPQSRAAHQQDESTTVRADTRTRARVTPDKGCEESPVVASNRHALGLGIGLGIAFILVGLAAAWFLVQRPDGVPTIETERLSLSSVVDQMSNATNLAAVSQAAASANDHADALSSYEYSDSADDRSLKSILDLFAALGTLEGISATDPQVWDDHQEQIRGAMDAVLADTHLSSVDEVQGRKLLETVGTLAQQAKIHALSQSALDQIRSIALEFKTKRDGLNKYFTTSSTGADLYAALEPRPDQWRQMKSDLDSVDVPASAVDIIAARDELSAALERGRVGIQDFLLRVPASYDCGFRCWNGVWQSTAGYYSKQNDRAMRRLVRRELPRLQEGLDASAPR